MSDADVSTSTPHYPWKKSFKDWCKHSALGSYTDEKVEHNLLSSLPFYPVSDGIRTLVVVNTDIGDGKYIHEVFIENTLEPVAGQSPETLDIVLVHGYAASLGLFVNNFDALSSVPGIKIHAIDLLGFGFSARPKFPKLPASTKDEVYKVEDWFIDAIEEWRKRRGINRFILMGHSFGGYLSCAYTMKYNKLVKDATTGISSSLVDKLVLISPVGVERNSKSLTRNDRSAAPAISASEQKSQNKKNQPGGDLAKVTANQEQIVSSQVPDKPREELSEFEVKNQDFSQTIFGKFLIMLWNRNFSVFSIVRGVGPFRSKWISNWTLRRFNHLYLTNRAEFQSWHDYMYRIFNGKGSGEYALTRILAFPVIAKLPLLDRCPQDFVSMNLPTLWLYGDQDWMDKDAGLQMTKEINDLAKYDKLATYEVIAKAGHHLYLDNPTSFTEEVFEFINAKVIEKPPVE